jgi:lipid-A-disaccharide synthase
VRIALVAGEASGDQLGAGLIGAIRARHPQARFCGIAGPRMLEAGCEGLYPMERLSVMGLVEVLGRYLELLPVRARLARRLMDERPDVFVGIDAPDFNLALEAKLRREGVPTVHYVSPSVWAWRGYRLRKIGRSVDRMLTLFPFEAPLYERHGIAVSFVGHPLADAIPDDTDVAGCRRALGLPPRGEVVALLPGSRMGEVSRLAESLVGAARWLRARRPGITFVAAMASAAIRGRFEDALAEHGAGIECLVVDGEARTTMGASDVVLLASGTASLETMLVKRPMVITYRMAGLTWAIGRRLLYVEHVGLPNLLAGRSLVPELLQDAATPERLGAAVLRWLENPDACAALRARFHAMHETLRHDADQRAADAVLEVAAQARPGRVTG